jgi:ABC-type ATPase involved in cell division
MTDHTGDHSIHSPDEDLLDRGAFVEGLAKALVKKSGDGYLATSVVLGLTGPWGSGKSSIINLLEEHLTKIGNKGIAVTVFNPWLVHGRDALLEAYFNSLRDAVGRSGAERVQDILSSLKELERNIKEISIPILILLCIVSIIISILTSLYFGISNGITIFLIFILFGSTNWFRKLISQEWLPTLNKKDLYNEKKVLEVKLAKKKIAVVVLIDELDRVEDDDVRVVAQMIKAIGDVKGISYLVAYDPDRVAGALGQGVGRSQRLESGRLYLEKIVQSPIPMRPLFINDVEKLFEAIIDGNFVEFKQSIDKFEYGSEILKYIISKLNTPREAKRLLGSYKIFNNMLDGEIPEIDILGYCWILTKSPVLRDRVAENFDELVDDPSNVYKRAAQSSSGNAKPSLVEILGKEADSQRELLELLFPYFGKQRSGSTDGDRISKRRNIVRLLYLGDPPHQVSRKAVDALWCKAVDETIDPDLKVLIDKNELGDFLDRLEDVLPSLSVDGDSKFWLALSKALVRPTDWLLEPEPNGNLADDAAAVLLNFGTSSDVNRERCKSIIKALMDSDDYTLLPKIVRRHLFAHGLVENQEKRNGKTIFDRDETLELVENVYKHFVNELSDGKFLRKILNGDALFMLIQSGLWTESETHSFTDLLENPDARKTVAALLTPPGYSIDKEALQGFMDVDKVLGFMKNANEGDTANDVWIDTCLRRFRAALEGKSLWNLND